MKYEFRWKERGQTKYKVLKDVTGHGYHAEQNKMVIYFDDKVMEIINWDQCAVLLGMDFLLMQKSAVKKDAGES